MILLYLRGKEMPVGTVEAVGMQQEWNGRLEEESSGIPVHT